VIVFQNVIKNQYVIHDFTSLFRDAVSIIIEANVHFPTGNQQQELTHVHLNVVKYLEKREPSFSDALQ
jgi:hypothetical protein